jgi:hypothetical protein
MPDGRLPPIMPIVLYNGDPRWRAAVELRDLIGLPEASSLWHWQPGLRYHLIDEGAFSTGELEGRGGLPALLFRLENAADPAELFGLVDAILAWFASQKGFQAARAVFAEMLGAAMAPLGPDVRVPGELLEVRNMLATRMARWREQSEQQLKQELEQQLKQQLEQQWLQEGEKRGEQRGEAALLLRQLERRFGVLPSWARERVLSAESVTMQAWGLRVLDAETLEEVLA